jgi:hypothetical protein
MDGEPNHYKTNKVDLRFTNIVMDSSYSAMFGRPLLPNAQIAHELS